MRPRVERFCEEYLVDHVGGDAYERAGFQVRSRRAAITGACRLLGRPDVQERIAILRKEVAHRTGNTPERALQEMARLAYAEMGAYSTWGPDGIALVDSSQLTPDQRAAVADVSMGVHGPRIKLHNKHDAVRTLMQYHGLLVDKPPIPPDELDDVIARQLARVAAAREVGASAAPPDDARGRTVRSRRRV